VQLYFKTFCGLEANFREFPQLWQELGMGKKLGRTTPNTPTAGLQGGAENGA
jgi:hypothetical protein